MKGFQQGTDLTTLAKSLKIPINPGFDKVIVVSDNKKSVRLNNINLHILGPTKKNIDKLRKEWNDWFSKKQKTVKTEFGLVQILDKSVPNLASITFLAEIKNRKILFTGDGLGQDVVDMLSKNEMLDENGKFHVDILKVPIMVVTGMYQKNFLIQSRLTTMLYLQMGGTTIHHFIR